MEEDVKKQIDNFDNLSKQLTNVMNRNFVDNLIKDNKIEFELKDIKYRVRLPTFKEKQDIYKKRNQKYFELLNTKDESGNYIYKSESDLKKLYRERGEDIDVLDKEFSALDQKQKGLMEKLGKALSEKRSDIETEAYKTEIESLEKQKHENSAKKTLLLELSLESQLLVFVYCYIGFLVTEKNVDNNWVKVWEKYEDFENSEDNLINTISIYVSLLMSSEAL